MCPRNRRTVLGLAAGTAATAIAGCLAETGEEKTDDDEGGVGSTTTGDESDAETDAEGGNTGDDASPSIGDDLEYRSWLPAPAAVEKEDYWAFYVDVGAVADAGVTQTATARIDDVFFPIPDPIISLDEVDAFATMGREATVCTYSIHRDGLADRLSAGLGGERPTATRTESGTGTHERTPTTESDEETTIGPSTESAPDGYVEYENGTRWVWLADDHLLYGRDPERMQGILDARMGDVDRYGETTDFGLVADAVDAEDIVAGRAQSQQFVENSTAFAYGWTFGDAEAAVTASFAFDSESALDREQVAALGDEPGFAEYGEFESSTNGRVASISGSIPIEEFDLLQRDEKDDSGTRTASAPPQVSFTFDFSLGKDGEWDGDEEERIVVTHQGGDNVDLDRIRLFYGTGPVRERGDVDSTPPAGDTWKAGGEWKLRPTAPDAFESAGRLVIVWNSVSGDTSQILAEATLP